MKQSNKHARRLIQPWKVCAHTYVFNKSREKVRMRQGRLRKGVAR